MKKILLAIAALSMLVVAVAPAIAEDNKDNNKDGNNLVTQRDLNQLERQLNQLDDFNNDEPFFNQENDQNVESGDSTQVFTVTGGGDNSNQCVGLQGVSNTGNQVTNNAVQQYASDGDVGISNGDFTVSPVNTTTCNQSVDQSAVALGS